MTDNKDIKDPNKKKKLIVLELEYIFFIVGYIIVFKYSTWQLSLGLTFILLGENLHVIRMVFSGNKDFWKEIWRKRK